MKALKPTQKKAIRSPEIGEKDLFQKLNYSSVGRSRNEGLISPKVNLQQERLQTSQSSVRGKSPFTSPKVSTYAPSERPKSPKLHHSPMKIGISQLSRVMIFYCLFLS